MKTGNGVFRQRRLPRRSPESGRTMAAASVSVGAAALVVEEGNGEVGEGRRVAARRMAASAAVHGDGTKRGGGEMREERGERDSAREFAAAAVRVPARHASRDPFPTPPEATPPL